jgi:hypothetical protein
MCMQAIFSSCEWIYFPFIHSPFSLIHSRMLSSSHTCACSFLLTHVSLLSLAHSLLSYVRYLILPFPLMHLHSSLFYSACIPSHAMCTSFLLPHVCFPFHTCALLFLAHAPYFLPLPHDPCMLSPILAHAPYSYLLSCALLVLYKGSSLSSGLISTKATNFLILSLLLFSLASISLCKSHHYTSFCTCLHGAISLLEKAGIQLCYARIKLSRIVGIVLDFVF